MALDIVLVNPTPLKSVQYDGTNGTEIFGLYSSACTLTSDDGDTLTISSSFGARSIHVGEWLVWAADVPQLDTTMGALSDADYNLKYVAA